MAVFRVERTRDYTVMCNHHLKDSGLSLKAKGLLSMMLSLPDEWNYSTRGLAAICKEGVDAIGKALKELEQAGYIVRRQLRGADGRICDTEYTIFEQPRPPDTALPDTENPYLDKEEYASYKSKYTKQAEDIRESVRVLKEKLTAVLENRSERNRWISQFTQFSTLETLDRRALIHMVQSIRVRGKKELDITFTHEDEYKKALQLLTLAAQQKDYEQRKVG